MTKNNDRSLSGRLSAALLAAVLGVTGANQALAHNDPECYNAYTGQNTSVPDKMHNTIEYLFRTEAPEKFWEYGRKFSRVVQNHARKNEFIHPALMKTLPVDFEKKATAFTNSTIPDLACFAKYVEFTAMRGTPRDFSQKTRLTDVVPKVLIGVLVPQGPAGSTEEMNQYVDDVVKMADKINQHYAPINGGMVWSVVRIVEPENRTLYSKTKDQTQNIQKGIIITAGGLPLLLDGKQFMPTDIYQAEVLLEYYFDKALHLAGPSIKHDSSSSNASAHQSSVHGQAGNGSSDGAEGSGDSGSASAGGDVEPPPEEIIAFNM